MNRLTQKDERGSWCLKGVAWEELRVGQVITREISEKLYSALWKLEDYEDTGLTPEEIRDGKMLTGWIPVAEQLPDVGEEVLGTDGSFVYFEEYGEDFGFEHEDIIAWMPLPEPYNAK